MLLRACFRCHQDKPATIEHFYRDKARPLGLSYECKPCLSARKKGRDRRKERWSNMTTEQKDAKRAAQNRYKKTLKGRAIFLRKAYARVDACDISVNEMMVLISQPCTHCGTTEINRGLDRINNDLPHVRGNVVPSCAPCNFARGDRFTFEEMKKIGAIIRQVIADRKPKEVENVAHLQTAPDHLL